MWSYSLLESDLCIRFVLLGGFRKSGQGVKALLNSGKG